MHGHGASTPGANLRGPHSHPGEGSVRAGPTTAEDPLRHRAAVFHPCKDPLTVELQAQEEGEK